MKSSKNVTLKNTIWAYLAIFSILILSFLWIFQILFLDKYYEWFKTKDIKLAALIIKEKYDKNSDISDTLNKILFEKGICINILENDTLFSYNNNMNKSCVPISDVNNYKNELIKNENKDILFTSDIKKYNIKNKSIIIYFNLLL